MIVQVDPDVAPIALVLLVTYREVENPASPLNRVAQQIVQMRDPWGKARQLTLIEAWQHIIIGITKDQPEIDCRDDLANLQPAEMDQL